MNKRELEGKGMNRLISVIVSLTVLFTISGLLISKHAKNEDLRSTSNINKKIHSDEFKQEYLGKGAYADWVENGFGIVNTNGTSPIASVLIHGRESEDIIIKIELLARIGALMEPLFEKEIIVPASSEVVVPVDLTGATNLHAKQMHYATKVRGTVHVVPEEGGRVAFRQRLEPRFLIVRNGVNKHEIMDYETMESM
ncbi:MAG: hypothetical protein ACTSXZ_09275, partial [Alphaproteobacteria bacterium]